MKEGELWNRQPITRNKENISDAELSDHSAPHVEHMLSDKEKNQHYN